MRMGIVAVLSIIAITLVLLGTLGPPTEWSIESHKTADEITIVEEPVQDGQTTVVRFRTKRDPHTVFTAVYYDPAEYERDKPLLQRGSRVNFTHSGNLLGIGSNTVENGSLERFTD